MKHIIIFKHPISDKIHFQKLEKGGSVSSECEILWDTNKDGFPIPQALKDDYQAQKLMEDQAEEARKSNRVTAVNELETLIDNWGSSTADQRKKGVRNLIKIVMGK